MDPENELYEMGSVDMGGMEHDPSCICITCNMETSKGIITESYDYHSQILEVDVVKLTFCSEVPKWTLKIWRNDFKREHNLRYVAFNTC